MNPAAPKVVFSSGFLPPQRGPLPAASQPHSIELPFPALEALPEYAGRIDSRDLQPAARHYNGSICVFGSSIFMAYRFETFSAVSKIGLCQLDREFNVIRDKELTIPEEAAVHFEDPRLTVINQRLILQFAHVRLGVPPICRQRMMVIGEPGDDFSGLRSIREVPIQFGDQFGIEKNWSPFEMEGGATGLVYAQRPRLVICAETKAGFNSTAAMITPGMKSTLSGRTPPLLLGDFGFLEFVGGHVPDQRRGARYWFGAQLFSPVAPYQVFRATRAPLVWGTEASPTLYSPRPYAGHPCCIFPSGVMRDGDDVIVSCGVNDSYIALFRFSITELFDKMEVVR